MIRLFVISIFFCLKLNAQVTTFEKIYNWGGNEIARSGVQAYDNGYAMVSGSYIFKTDSLGDSLWRKTYTHNFFSIQETSDSGFVMAGSKSFPLPARTEISLVKTDRNGDSLWTKTYYPNLGSNFRYIATSVRQTFDGGFIAAGTTQAFADTTQYYFLIRTNGQGDSLWTKIFKIGGSDILDRRDIQVRQTADSGFVFVGYKSYSMGLTPKGDLWVIKTDKHGDTLWSKTYNEGTIAWGSWIEQLSDSGYIITGTTNSSDNPQISNVYLIRVNVNGDIIWSKAYGVTNYYDIGESVETIERGYIIGVNAIGSINGYLIKTNENGDTLCTKRLRNSSSIIEVHQARDRGYIVFGFLTFYMPVRSDLYLVKTDSLCYPLEPLVIDSQSLSQTFCNPQTSDTLWVAANGRANISYQWYKDSTVLFGEENDSLFIPNVGFNDNGVYWCMVHDALDTIYSAPIVVDVLEVSVSIANEITCYDSSNGIIEISAQGGFWVLNYSIDGSNYQSGNIYSGLSANTYSGYVKDSLDFICTTSPITLSSPSPFITETITTPVTDSSSGSIRIKVLSGGVEPFIYSLDGISFQDSSIFYGLAAGDYVVAVRDSVGCEDTVHVRINSTVGMNNFGGSKPKVKIFPNPTNSLLHVNLTETTFFLQFIRLFSITGQELLLIRSSKNSRYSILNSEHLPAGIYFCEIILTNGERVVRKVTVE
ncbi:MAG: T9SS type A sorting domain-containing protein [Chitinophagales bacterium]|nr:T9SS type A sorting domain-containing protein [Chitinophagales bacterium]